MAYHTLKRLLLTLFLVYVTVALYATHTPRGEVYPFFSWFVFTRVPPRVQTVYSVRVLAAEGKPLRSPLSFQEAYGVYFDSRVARAQYHYLIRSLGEALAHESRVDIERHRQALEKTVLSQRLTYEVVKIAIDTLEHWRKGAVLGVEPIAAFNISPEGL